MLEKKQKKNITRSLLQNIGKNMVSKALKEIVNDEVLNEFFEQLNDKFHDAVNYNEDLVDEFLCEIYEGITKVIDKNNFSEEERKQFIKAEIEEVMPAVFDELVLNHLVAQGILLNEEQVEFEPQDFSVDLFKKKGKGKLN